MAGWTPELKELRKTTYRLRRRKQRACKRDYNSAGPLVAEYKDACKALHRGMVRARVQAWEELCCSLNDDTWGKPFRVVMAKLRANEPPPCLTRDMAERVFAGLFLIPEDEGTRRDPLRRVEYPRRLPTEDSSEWAIDEPELREAITKLNVSKAPGWDSVPPMVVKGLGNHDTPRLLALVNQVFASGEFPSPWKTTMVTLLRKPVKNPTRPDAYRPICIVDAGFLSRMT